MRMPAELLSINGRHDTMEHDATILSHCHRITEMGPGSGTSGGEVIAEGTPFLLKQNERSMIGNHLHQCTVHRRRGTGGEEGAGSGRT